MVWTATAAFLVLGYLAYQTIKDEAHNPSPALSPVDGALRIARGRLVRGEITAEDYVRIVRVLQS